MAVQKTNRQGRVNDVLHRKLAEILQFYLIENREILVTISAVDISPDLHNAKVFVVLLDENKKSEILLLLNKQAKYFRTELAKQMSLRKVPNLEFVYDMSLIEGNRINFLLDECNL